MIHDQYFTELVKMDGPLNVPSTRMRRRPDGILSNGLPMGLSPRRSGSRTPFKTPNIAGKTPDLTRTPGKTPIKPFTGLPQQRGPWKTPSKTPNKGLKNNNQDRFIPTRTCSDLDSATFAITKTDEEDDERKPSNYEMQISEALNVPVKDAKILSYQAAKPKPAEGYINSLNVVYSQKAKKGGPNKTYRLISSAPERILDAPELRDDYYLNLMDWSCNNQIAVGLDNAVYLWNASTGKIALLMETNPDEYVCSVKWITEGNYLAVGTSEGAVELYDVEGEKLLRTMQGHAARVGSLAWNSYICSSGSRSGAIHHHDVRIADHQVATLVGHTQEVCGLAWSPDGRYLASGGNDNVLHVWNKELGTDVPAQQTYTYHQAAVKAIAWCPWQHNILASGGGTADRTIRLWDVNMATLVGVKDTGSQVCSIQFSKEYRELVSGHGYSKNQLSIWKYPDFANIVDLLGHKARILSMTMSPDGTLVASAAADQTIRVWKCFEAKKKTATTGVKNTKESSILMKPSIR